MKLTRNDSLDRNGTNDEESLLCLFNKTIALHKRTLLRNAVTKDVATSAMLDSLLNAKKHDKVTKFVNDRLCGNDTGTVQVKFNDPLKKSNAPTFHDFVQEVFFNQEREHR